MSEIKVASRYAKSILDLAIEKGKVEEVNNDMKLFHATLKGSSELRAVLSNPIVSINDKLAVIKALFGNKVQEISLAYFNIMLNKGRGGYLYESSKQFFSQYNILNNIVIAKLVSSTQMNQDHLKLIEENLTKTLNSKIILDTKVDPSLIGGFVLTVGDKQFDASISRQFTRLKKELQN